MSVAEGRVVVRVEEVVVEGGSVVLLAEGRELDGAGVVVAEGELLEVEVVAAGAARGREEERESLVASRLGASLLIVQIGEISQNIRIWRGKET